MADGHFLTLERASGDRQTAPCEPRSSFNSRLTDRLFSFPNAIIAILVAKVFWTCRERIVDTDLGWHLRVEAWRATEYAGELALSDPDGIVVDACFVNRRLCVDHLAGCSQWVREPLADWLELFDDEDVCVGPVATLREAADMLGTGTALPSAPVGQHTERWRGELGLS